MILGIWQKTYEKILSSELAYPTMGSERLCWSGGCYTDGMFKRFNVVWIVGGLMFREICL